MPQIADTFVLAELREIRNLEADLRTRWADVKRSGKASYGMFIDSLIELQSRATRLERLLDSTMIG